MDSGLLFGLVFGGIAIPTFWLLNRLLDPQRDRLRRLAQDFETDRGHSLLSGAWVAGLAALTPGIRPGGQRDLEQLLRAGGATSPTAAQEYRAVRLLAILIALGVAGALGRSRRRSFSTRSPSAGRWPSGWPSASRGR